ncbi:MAG TPA: DUF4340 domain-containing protein [Verrucomicrobiae bacterium]|jgi:hypothetical protein|nr:DUF4340 domain-containing protein [Verrucomicrobiae bacterium]
MNRKQFFTLVVLGLVVGGLGLYFYGKNKESFTQSSFQTGQKVLSNFPLNDIAQVRIKAPTNEVNLVRGAEGWTVKERWNYPANFSEISEFLRKAWELKPVQDVPVGKSQYGRLDLLNPTENQGTNAGTLVEFKGTNAATLKSIVLGKKATKESAGGGPFGGGGGGEYPVGRYVMVPENPPKVWLVNETFSSIETKPEQWLNKDFFKIEKVKAVSVDYPEKPTNSWSVVRETETGDWKLADAKPDENFDHTKASGLNYALSSPSFNDVAAPELNTEQAGLAKPTVAKLETFEGFTYTVDVGAKTNEDNSFLKVKVTGNFPSQRTPGKDEKPEDKEKLDKEFKDKTEKLNEKLKNEQKLEKWTYLVSKWTVDSLLKERKDFMTEKKEEKKPETSATSPKPVDLSAPPIETLPPELKNLPVAPAPTEPKTAPAPEKKETEKKESGDGK